MTWLKCLAGFLLIIQSLASDVKIYWSDHYIDGQVVNVLYGSAVEFRCFNKTVDNLYEVSKEEYERCEPMEYQHSLLNCTRDTQRGRDIYTTLIVQHDVPDPYFKDYVIGQSYYFISTASNRGTDQERISNIAGGRCRYSNMKITLHVVNSLSKSTSDASDTGASTIPDPGGHDPPEDPHSDTTAEESDITPSNNYTNDLGDDTNPAVVQGLDQSGAADNSAISAHSSQILALLLLTLVYILNS